MSSPSPHFLFSFFLVSFYGLTKLYWSLDGLMYCGKVQMHMPTNATTKTATAITRFCCAAGGAATTVDDDELDESPLWSVDFSVLKIAPDKNPSNI